jgi:hypothetical protein
LKRTAGNLRHLRALVFRVAARLCAEPLGGWRRRIGETDGLLLAW